MSFAIPTSRKFGCQPNVLGGNSQLLSEILGWKVQDHVVRGISDKAQLPIYWMLLLATKDMVALWAAVPTGHISLMNTDYILYISCGTFHSQLKYKIKTKVCPWFHKASQVVTLGLCTLLAWDMFCFLPVTPTSFGNITQRIYPVVSCRYWWVTKEKQNSSSDPLYKIRMSVRSSNPLLFLDSYQHRVPTNSWDRTWTLRD